MNLWIQIDVGIREHDKIYNLADALKISDAHATGLMVCLWTWAVTSAPDGDITNFPPRALAKAAGWEKKPEAFFEAICSPQSLFVEKAAGRLRFRNWDVRAGMLMEAIDRGREQTRKRVQRYRDKKAAENPDGVTDGNGDVTGNKSVTPSASNATVTVGIKGESVTVTPLTVPNMTVPDKSALPDSSVTEDISPIPPKGGKAAGDKLPKADERFDAFWALYPKKVGKEAARKVWKRLKPDAELYQSIVDAIPRAQQNEQWRRENGRFIPNPTTWLNQGRWDDELPTGGDGNGRDGEDFGRDSEAGSESWRDFRPSTGFKHTDPDDE